MRRSTTLHSIDDAVSREIQSDKYSNVVTVGENIDNVVAVSDTITDGRLQQAIDSINVVNDLVNMNTLTGEPGTEVIWDSVTSTMTIPRGNTGPQGPVGATGQDGLSFRIDGIFNSVAELLAGSVGDGYFGVVAGTLDPIDPDYGRLYYYDSVSDPAAPWTYITDMSVAAEGIIGPEGVGIVSVLRTDGDGSANSTDTYTITLSDASTYTFTVVNGTTGLTGNGIANIIRTSGNGAAGTVDTYTITYTNATTSTFNVTNGANGIDGIDGTSVTMTSVVNNLNGTYTWNFSDGSTFTTEDLTGPQGLPGEDVDHVSKTAGTGAPGTTDTYTLWQDVGETVSLGTFTAYNGADGLGTGDMLASVYDPTGIYASAFSVDNHLDGITNKVYTAAEEVKLANIEAGATADQTDLEIEALYEALPDTNKYTDAEKLKLAEFKIDDVNITNKIGNPIHIDTYLEVFNHSYSSGILGGCDLTDNGNGTVNIAVGSAVLRAPGDTGHGTVYSAEVPSATALVLTDNATNYVYISYNDGITVTWGVTTSPATINLIDVVPAYVITREGLQLNIVDARNQNVDHVGKNQVKEFYTNTFARKNGGSIISDKGTLHIGCTAGAFYFQLNEIAVPALDTTGLDTFEYYKHVAGSFVETDASVLDNAFYDNGTDLVALGNNQYGVHWVYAVVGTTAHYAVLYGTGSYANIALAEASEAPSDLPPSVSGLGVLVGRFITQQGNAEIIGAASAFKTAFQSTLASDHENLSGLLGGAVGDHIHLTTTEHTKLTNIEDGATADQIASEVPNTPAGNIAATNVQAALNELDTEKQAISEKGVANGYASLDESGLVPTAQLPSYVDDVLEVATYAALPVTGATGIIYVVVADETSGGDTSTYRWTGTVYAMVSNTLSASDVEALYEGIANTNKYTDAEKSKLSTIENVDNHTDGATNGVYTLAERAQLASIETTIETIAVANAIAMSIALG